MNTLPKKIAAYGNNRMAAALKVSPQAVSKWAKRGEVPPRRVRAVAELLGMTPQSLSPEVFGSDVDAAKETP